MNAERRREMVKESLGVSHLSTGGNKMLWKHHRSALTQCPQKTTPEGRLGLDVDKGHLTASGYSVFREWPDGHPTRAKVPASNVHRQITVDTEGELDGDVSMRTILVALPDIHRPEVSKYQRPVPHRATASSVPAVRD